MTTPQIEWDQISRFFSTLFGQHTWADNQSIILRGIGEKGTAKEGVFSEDVVVQPEVMAVSDCAAASALRWSQHNIGAFVVPAVLNGTRAKEENVVGLPAVILDLDSVPGWEVVRWLEEHVGAPSMVVTSGGKNEWGPKLHAFYCLERESALEYMVDDDQAGSEKNWCPDRATKLSMRLAALVGGDPSYGLRRTQPIRIPGTIHLKGGEPKEVRLESCTDDTYTLAELEGKIEKLAPSPWGGYGVKAGGDGAHRSLGGKRDFSFSPTSGQDNGTTLLLSQTVREGGQDGITRYDAFNRVAGHYLHQARMGKLSKDEAYNGLSGWVLACMVPPWEDHLVAKHWNALLEIELRERGPFPEPERYRPLFGPGSIAEEAMANKQSTGMFSPRSGIMESHSEVSAEHEEPTEYDNEGGHPATLASSALHILDSHQNHVIQKQAPNQPEPAKAILSFAAHRWIVEPKPSHCFLVDQLIIKGEPHLFVAEGGAGKTFLMADLAMKIAAAGAWAEEAGGEAMGITAAQAGFEWCGQKILQGGTTVLILNEDSPTEMHIRLLELDKQGLIKMAGDKLIVLPMTALGGSFPLTERDNKTGNSTPHHRWVSMLEALKTIPDIAMVAIDTLNSVTHGDENSAVVIGEMMREAGKVCGELKAALVMNHHIRKSNEPIRSLEEMKESIRGSSAIPSHFRINLGMWRATDWERRCKSIGIKPHKNSVWRFGVLKCNIMGLLDGEKTLARTDNGIIDATEKDPFNRANTRLRLAWLLISIEQAAKDGKPFSNGGKNDTNGLYKRRSQLPEELNKLGWREMDNLVNMSLEAGAVLPCAAKGSASAKWLDIKGGEYAEDAAGAEITKGAWSHPNWDLWAYDEGQEKCVRKAKVSAVLELD